MILGVFLAPNSVGRLYNAQLFGRLAWGGSIADVELRIPAVCDPISEVSFGPTVLQPTFARTAQCPHGKAWDGPPGTLQKVPPRPSRRRDGRAREADMYRNMYLWYGTITLACLPCHLDVSLARPHIPWTFTFSAHTHTQIPSLRASLPFFLPLRPIPLTLNFVSHTQGGTANV
jgi:hypothetical protein